MSIREWKIKKVPLSALNALADNPRKISAANARGLRASLNRFGMVELIVWNERTGNIVSGHQRRAILEAAGVSEVPVIAVDMSPEEERAAALTMNNFAIEGEFDNPAVELLESVMSADVNLYASLRMAQLKDDLSELMDKAEAALPQVPAGETRAAPEGAAEEWDTECPCCRHKWKIRPQDVALVASEEVGSQLPTPKGSGLEPRGESPGLTRRPKVKRW